MRHFMLAALLAASTHAAPTMYDYSPFTSFCTANSWDPNVWQQLDMDKYIADKSQSLARNISNLGLIPAWEGAITDFNFHDSSCSRNLDNCDPRTLDRYCKPFPKMVLALTSAIHYAKYIGLMHDRILTISNQVSQELAGLPGTFAPNNKTVIAAKSPSNFEIASNALNFVNAFIGFRPGLGLITKEVIGGAAALKAISATAGAMSIADASLTKAGFETTAPQQTELQFESYAKIMSDLADFTDMLNKGKDAALDKMFLPKQVNPWQNFNVDFISKPIAGGGFVEDIPVTATLDSYKALRAALIAPAINTLWRWQGVYIVKVSKANFAKVGVDFDPCKDSKFFANVKYCDKDGNMFVIQNIVKVPDDVQSAPKDWWRDPSNFAVPGFDSLAKYDLTPEIVMKASWNNWKAHGRDATGPSPQDAIAQTLKAGASHPPPEDYTFFNLPVMDYDKMGSDYRGNYYATSVPNDCKIGAEWFGIRTKDDQIWCTFYELRAFVPS